MQAILTRPDGTPVHTGLTLTPTRYGAAAEGGPVGAEIAISGDRGALVDALGWLECGVEIYNDSGMIVWWGLVQSASVTLAGTTYTRDAGPVVNAATVIYTDADGNSASEGAQDAHSVELNGRRETQVTADATDEIGRAHV